MAKAKSTLFTAVKQSLGEHTQLAGVVSPTDLSFYTHEGTIVMRTKPKSVKPHSAKQQERTQAWKDADCMWRFMTSGQRALWTLLYNRAKESGLTIKTPRTKVVEETEPIKFKDMGQLSYFMSNALRYDLIDYLGNYLESEWQLVSIETEGENFVLTAKLTNPDQLAEALNLPQRTPIRGRM